MIVFRSLESGDGIGARVVVRALMVVVVFLADSFEIPAFETFSSGAQTSFQICRCSTVIVISTKSLQSRRSHQHSFILLLNVAKTQLMLRLETFLTESGKVSENACFANCRGLVNRGLTGVAMRILQFGILQLETYEKK